MPGPFGALVEELSVRVHPAMAEQIFLKAARLRMDPSAYLRDIIYRHETGRSYSEHVADAIESRNEAMFGKASERNRNEDVSDGSLPILRRVST